MDKFSLYFVDHDILVPSVSPSPFVISISTQRKFNDYRASGSKMMSKFKINLNISIVKFISHVISQQRLFWVFELALCSVLPLSRANSFSFEICCETRFSVDWQYKSFVIYCYIYCVSLLICWSIVWICLVLLNCRKRFFTYVFCSLREYFRFGFPYINCFQFFFTDEVPPGYQPILQIIQTKKVITGNIRARLFDGVFRYSGNLYFPFTLYIASLVSKAIHVLQIVSWLVPASKTIQESRTQHR